MDNKPITIMYLTDTLISPPDNPKAGGAEKQLYLLSTSLDSQVFKPIVIQLSPFSSIPLEGGAVGNLDVYHFPTRKLYDINGVRQLTKILSLSKQRKVDIIHSFFEKSEVFAWLTAKLTNIPVWVTSRRDLGFKRSKIFNRFFSFSSCDCSKCIANCYAIKDQIISEEGIPQGKIEVIYNGMDFAPYKKKYDERILRHNLGLKDNVRLVGMIANFYHEIKGHQFFLEAAKIIQKKIPDVEFVLVGDGFLIDQYREKAEEMGLNGKVHFLGKRGDVPAILSILCVSVLCSTSEGLSNTILESMAAGKPVVATRVGGNSELVIDGKTGCLVPPADSSFLAQSIISLLQNPGKASAMGLAGKAEAERKFTQKTMTERYENLYKSFISGLEKGNVAIH